MSHGPHDTFSTRRSLRAGGRTYTYSSLEALERHGLRIGGLPASIRILLENLLRNEDGLSFLPEHVEALARWSPAGAAAREIPFMPARVLLQDFTGVPAVVDLADGSAHLLQRADTMGTDGRALLQYLWWLLSPKVLDRPVIRLRRGVARRIALAAAAATVMFVTAYVMVMTEPSRRINLIGVADPSTGRFAPTP